MKDIEKAGGQPAKEQHKTKDKTNIVKKSFVVKPTFWVYDIPISYESEVGKKGDYRITTATLKDFLDTVCCDKDYARKIKSVLDAKKIDRKKYSSAKIAYAIKAMVGATFKTDNDRSAANIDQISGIMQFDIQGCQSPDKIAWIKSQRETLLLSKSIGQGLGDYVLFVLSAAKSVDYYKRCWSAYAERLKEQGIEFDNTPSPVHVRFVPHDPDYFLNVSPERFRVTGYTATESLNIITEKLKGQGLEWADGKRYTMCTKVAGETINYGIYLDEVYKYYGDSLTDDSKKRLAELYETWKSDFGKLSENTSLVLSVIDKFKWEDFWKKDDDKTITIHKYSSERCEFVANKLLRILSPVNSGGELFVFDDTHYVELKESNITSFLIRLKHASWGSDYKLDIAKKIYSLLIQLAPIARWDNDSINFKNGLYNINTGTFKETRTPADMVSHCLEFDYDQKSTNSLWDSFMDDITKGKQEMKDLLYEIVAHFFIRTHKFEKIAVLLGDGENGKSVFGNVIGLMLGDRTTYYSLDDLLHDQKGEYYRSFISGKILNISNEVANKYNDNQFKLYASGEQMTARHPGGKPVTIDNYGRCLVMTNKLKQRVENSHATYRRYIIIPFEFRVPPEKKNIRLIEDIKVAGFSGIMKHIIEAATRLKNNKYVFTKYSGSDKALAKFKEDTDLVKQFFLAEYVLDKNGLISAKDLFSEWQSWSLRTLPTRTLKLKKDFVAEFIKTTGTEAAIKGKVLYIKGISMLK